MKRKPHFRIILITAMLTFGALTITKMTFYTEQVKHCEKSPHHTYHSADNSN